MRRVNLYRTGMKILVLGAGRTGLGAAYDLAHSDGVEAVTVAELRTTDQ